jgi:hypothetical protein
VNAIAMVGSRPIRSDTAPKNGRARPFITLSTTRAMLSTLAPNSAALLLNP